MPYWTFLEFVKENGEGAIEEWLSPPNMISVRERVKAELDNKLVRLAMQEELRRPDTGYLGGPECRGLYEIRIKVQRVHYRPIFFYGPARGQVTLLAGAIEKDRRLEPHSICDVAQQRKRLALQGKGYVREYFS